MRSYLKWLKLSDQCGIPSNCGSFFADSSHRYKQALRSASALQDAAKDAAGKLRGQQNEFASHKKAINSRIKSLKTAQFKLAAWKYAMKLVQ